MNLDHSQYAYINNKKPLVTLVAPVKEVLQKSLTFSRASIIPYIIVEGVHYYCFFVDAKYHQITDCGGGVSPKEHIVDEAIRECREESLGCIDLERFRQDIIDTTTCAYNNTQITIFVQIAGTLESMQAMTTIFRQIYEAKFLSMMQGTYVSRCTMENSFMVFLTLPELTGLALGGQIVMPEYYHNLLHEGTQRLTTAITPYIQTEMKAYEIVAASIPVPLSSFATEEDINALVKDMEKMTFKKRKTPKVKGLQYTPTVSRTYKPEYLHDTYIRRPAPFRKTYPSIWSTVRLFLLPMLVGRGA